MCKKTSSLLVIILMLSFLSGCVPYTSETRLLYLNSKDIDSTCVDRNLSKKFEKTEKDLIEDDRASYRQGYKKEFSGKIYANVHAAGSPQAERNKYADIIFFNEKDIHGFVFKSDPITYNVVPMAFTVLDPLLVKGEKVVSNNQFNEYLKNNDEAFFEREMTLEKNKILRYQNVKFKYYKSEEELEKAIMQETGLDVLVDWSL